jgi:hypothetical protein
MTMNKHRRPKIIPQRSHNKTFNEAAHGCSGKGSNGRSNKAFNAAAPINHTNKPTVGQLVGAKII